MSENDDAAELLAKQDGEVATKAETVETPAPPQVLRIFVSYASEDEDIARAIASGLERALGDDSVHLDRWFLQAGDPFKQEIEHKLDKTDILVVVFTGRDKESHSWTGWELGYFTAVMKQRQGAKIVPMYLNAPPDTIVGLHGINIGLTDELLELPAARFERRNVINDDDGMYTFIRGLQERIGVSAASARTCIRTMRTAIFKALRKRPRKTISPQRQIVFVTTDTAFQEHMPDLPPDARLRPSKEGSPMQIFGLPDRARSWKEFKNMIAKRTHAASWQRAITTVINSSFPENVNVDNSQLIISEDNSKSYRIILTACTSFFDRREFSLSFVEALRRPDGGDEEGNRLLKAFVIACRFRFLFLQTTSDFSGRAIEATSIEGLRERAENLLRELDLLRRDAVEAGLGNANDWGDFGDWSRLSAVSQAVEPLEKSMRRIAGRIVDTRDDDDALRQLRNSLAAVARKLEAATRQQNGRLIRVLPDKIQAQLLRSAEPAASAVGSSARTHKRGTAGKRVAPVRNAVRSGQAALKSIDGTRSAKVRRKSKGRRA
jgi:hypothetical protein